MPSSAANDVDLIRQFKNSGGIYDHEEASQCHQE